MTDTIRMEDVVPAPQILATIRRELTHVGPPDYSDEGMNNYYARCAVFVAYLRGYVGEDA